MEQLTGSKLGKEYNKAVYCHLIYLTYMHHEYIMQNARLDDSQAGIKIVRRNISNLKYADDAILKAESVKKKKKTDLKLNFQKTKIMASGLIITWQIHEGKVEAVTDFIFLGFKSLQTMTAAIKLKDACFLEGKL